MINSPAPFKIPPFLGILILLIAFTVLVGWVFDIGLLVQIHPDFVPMQFNTALGFFAVGLGLVMMGRRQKGLVFTGAFLLTLGGLTLLQYLLKMDFGIDELLMEHGITTKTSHPGRMAFNTALNFLLMGFIFLLSGLRKIKGNSSLLPEGLLATAVTSLGLVALFGYLVSIETAYQWSSYTAMAVHTSLGFILGGVGVILHTALSQKNKSWLIYLPSIFSLIFTICIFMALDLEERKQDFKRRKSLATMTSNQINEKFEFHRLALERMCRRWVARGGTPSKEWLLEANFYIGDLAGIEGLAIRGSTGEILMMSDAFMDKVDPDGQGCSSEKPEFFKISQHKNDGLFCLELPLDPKTLNAGSLIVHLKASAYVEGLNPSIPSASLTFGKASPPLHTNPDVFRLEVAFFEEKGILSLNIPREHSYSSLWFLPIGVFITAMVAFISFLVLRIVRQNQSMRFIMDHVNDGFWDWDLGPEGKGTDKEYLSPKLKSMLGYEDHEMENRPSSWQSLIHPDDLQVAVQKFGDHIESEGKSPFYLEARYTHREGHTVWVICRGVAIKNPLTGKFTRMVGTHTDITPLKHAEAKLKEQQLALEVAEERFRLATEASISGIWDWVDVNGEEVWWSDQFYRILGYEPHEIESSLKLFGDLLHPEDREGIFKALQDHLATGSPYDVEYRLQHRSGDYIWIWAKGECIRDGAGKALRMVGTVTDIEERVRLTHNLLRANEELKEFAYVASHDLQEPLRKVQSYLRLMEDELPDDVGEDIPQYIERTLSSCDRMRSMINALLEYSRASKKDEQQQAVDLNKTLKEVLQVLEIEISENRAEVDIDEGLPNLHGSRVQMMRLFQNLISNAIKYRHPERPPHIEVFAESLDTGKVRLSIRDNGLGIPADMLERIFMPFKRLHRKEEIPGTGMGLSICKKIVEHHGGRIMVKSEGGKGTSFELEFPPPPII